MIENGNEIHINNLNYKNNTFKKAKAIHLRHSSNILVENIYIDTITH